MQILLQAARWLRAAASESHYACTRIAALIQSPDRYLPEPGQAPADYGEFLFRTSGALLHEPSARDRQQATRCRQGGR